MKNTILFSRKPIWVVFLAAALLLVWFSSAMASPEGKPAPDFSLVNLNGEKVSLSDFRGKVVVLTFWATWCGACHKQIPALQELYRAYKDKDVVVIGLSLDFDQTDRVKAFVQQENLDYKILVATLDVAQNYGVRAIPYTLVIDKQQKLVKRYIGPKSYGDLKKDLDTLL